MHWSFFQKAKAAVKQQVLPRTQIKSQICLIKLNNTHTIWKSTDKANFSLMENQIVDYEPELTTREHLQQASSLLPCLRKWAQNGKIHPIILIVHLLQIQCHVLTMMSTPLWKKGIEHIENTRLSSILKQKYKRDRLREKKKRHMPEF